jgi:hypothetical protein
MDSISALEKIELFLKKVWKRYSDRQVEIKAFHCEFAVEPKMFLAENEVNPEVMRLLISLCLERSQPEDYTSGKIKVLPDRVLIHDKAGHLLVEVTDPKLIGKAKKNQA